ncbi:rluD [Symbiodinium sp. CCMP2592]|nr:rluD [Symbiodinium sp. CCMP2592]
MEGLLQIKSLGTTSYVGDTMNPRKQPPSCPLLGRSIPLTKDGQRRMCQSTLPFQCFSIFTLQTNADPTTNSIYASEKYPLLFSEVHQYGIIHRLDVPSSGLILVGKTFVGYFALRWQQDTYELGRHYLVLCHGHFTAGKHIINARIKTSKTFPATSRVSAAGKPAWTQVEALCLLARGDQPFSLLLVLIRTGRTHQIRVHLQHAGHPTVCDEKYTDPAVFAEDVSWCPRNFLHRFELTFQDCDGQARAARAALPEDLQAVLATLRAIEGEAQTPPVPSAIRRALTPPPATTPQEAHTRISNLEQLVQELRGDLRRQRAEAQRQEEKVESLSQIVRRLDAQVTLHPAPKEELPSAAVATSVSPDFKELKQIMEQTLIELEMLSRRATDYLDQTAAASMKHIQELRRRAAGVAVSRTDEGRVPAAINTQDLAFDDVSEATCFSPGRHADLLASTSLGFESFRAV